LSGESLGTGEPVGIASAARRVRPPAQANPARAAPRESCWKKNRRFMAQENLRGTEKIVRRANTNGNSF
jgi:hypothetical protein